jgi:hypothetical protein
MFVTDVGKHRREVVEFYVNTAWDTVSASSAIAIKRICALKAEMGQVAK